MRLPFKPIPLLTQPVLIVTILVAAAALRAWRLGHGLPDFVEEAAPFRIALAMRGLDGAIDWNPHAFQEPSLSVYLHFALQQIAFAIGHLLGHYGSWADWLLAYHVDPTPMVLAARSLGVACDLITLLAAVRIGNRIAPGAGLVAGLFLAFAPTMIATSRSIVADSAMTALAAWSIERALAGFAGRRWGPRVAAAALAGLAMGAGYAAFVALLALGGLVWVREADRPMRERVRGITGLLAVAGLAFAITTPFALLDPVTFVRDVFFAGRHADDAFFGGAPRVGLGFHAGRIGWNLGMIGAVLLVASPAIAWLDPRRRPAIVTLWFAALGFGVPVSIARVDGSSHLLPALAAASVLAAVTLFAALRPFHRGARVGFASIVLALLSAPLVLGGLRAASLGSDTTQLQARRWCEKYLRPTELMIQESHAARLPTAVQLDALRGSAEYRAASARWRARVDEQRTHRAVTLPIWPSGSVSVTIDPPGAPPEELEVFEHAGQLHRAFYDPRLFSGVDYFMSSSAVRGRYESEVKRFPVQAAFYRLLENAAEEVARFKPRGDVEGPEIVVYRLGSRYRAGIELRGPLDSLWWTASVPVAYRERAGALLAPRPPAAAPAPAAEGPVAQATATQGAVLVTSEVVVAARVRARRDTAGDAAANAVPSPSDSLRSTLAALRAAQRVSLDSARTRAWIASLEPMYGERIRPFVDRLAAELATSRRWEPAFRLALATHVMHPADPGACAVASACARGAGRHDRAREIVERTLSVHHDALRSPALRSELARLLETSGDEGWRRELEMLAAGAGPGEAFVLEAPRKLATAP